MEKTVWDEKAITAAIDRKERGIRLRKISDGAILSARERFHEIYRSMVMAGESSVTSYVAYKAYDRIAKERGLL